MASTQPGGFSASGGTGGTYSQPQANDDTATGSASNNNVNQLQTQVDQVVDIMRVNVNKVLERDQKLSDLEGRAESLEGGARQFSATSARVKRKYWWKNLKMWLILIGVIAVIIIIIIIWVVVEVKKRENGATATTPTTTTPRGRS